VILVKAPKQLRLLRTVERSGWSEKEFELREARQWTEEKKETFSRWCIHNDEQKALIPQVLDVHRQILEL
jgi:dephospho-CoA kinase